MPLQLYNKEQILDTCLAVFACHGYEKTSTVMLAEAAGISRALIFHHFKSKKELYLNILERCCEKVKTEFGADPLSEYKVFFEAKEKFSLLKLDYIKKNHDVYKVLFEAFHATPDELKTDVEEKYGAYGVLRATMDKRLKQLFEKVPLREGVDREQAFELIKIVLDYFERKCFSELTDENELDETYWQRFLDKRNNFLNMIRYGIEQKRD